MANDRREAGTTHEYHPDVAKSLLDQGFAQPAKAKVEPEKVEKGEPEKVEKVKTEKGEK